MHALAHLVVALGSALALVVPPLGLAPAAAVPSGLQVGNFGGSVFISPPSADDAKDSVNDLFVDVYHDRVEITERSGEVSIGVHPSSEPGCSLSGRTVTCTGTLSMHSVYTQGGDDRIEWAVPSDPAGRLSYSTDCGAGDVDEVVISDGGTSDAVAGVADNTDCEYIEINGHVLRDDRPDPEPVEAEPFAETNGLVKVAKEKTQFGPACWNGKDSCGSFEFSYLAKAQTALSKTGLNQKVTIKKVTSYQDALDLLKPLKKNGTVDRIDNFVDGQVLKQTETIDKAWYKKKKVSTAKFRAADLDIPYQTTLTVYVEPIPDPPGKCPYATGVYSDIDPQTKGKQEYDVALELAGPRGTGSGVTPEFAEQALVTKFKCANVSVVRTPRPASTAAQPAVTDVVFDKAAKSVTVLADVPARSDLVMQLSGRSRGDWLDHPAQVDLFDEELGPLVDGTLPLSPSNRTSINVRLFERATGRAIVGTGTTMILDADGAVLAQQASDGIGAATLSLPLTRSGPISIVSSVKLANGRTLTAYAQRRVRDAGPVVATARGAVFSRNGEGVYVRDTQTALTGTTLGAAQGAMQRMMDLLRGAPDGTSAAQAKAIVDANVGLQSTRPTAVLRRVHEMTGYELASMHLNVSATADDPVRLSDPAPGAVVVSAVQVVNGAGLAGQFVSAVRGAATGVTAVLTGPMSTLLGGNTELGLGTGGLIANGDWISDQGSAPRAVAAHRGLGDWFGSLVALAQGASTAVGTALQRVATTVQVGVEAVARVFAGGSASAATATIGSRTLLLPPKVATVPAALPLNVGTLAVGQVKGAQIVAGGAGNLRDGSGRLIGNDGSGLIANDGTSLLAKVNGALIANDGAGLIANDGTSLLANDGASLLANDGGSLRSSLPVGLIANDGAGLIANDGAGLIANDGAAIVAGGAGN